MCAKENGSVQCHPTKSIDRTKIEKLHEPNSYLNDYASIISLVIRVTVFHCSKCITFEKIGSFTRDEPQCLSLY